MKRILLMVGVMITSLAFGQKIKEQDVPPVVKSAFQKQYPTAKEIKWEKEKGNYEVNFDLNEIDNSVLYDINGKMLESEVEIAISQLPAGVMEYVNSKYAGKKVKEVAKITGADGTVTYEAGIKGKDLIFDSNGKFIKEIKDKE